MYITNKTFKNKKYSTKFLTRRVRRNRLVEIVQVISEIIDNFKLNISWLFMEARYYKIEKKDS